MDLGLLKEANEGGVDLELLKEANPGNTRGFCKVTFVRIPSRFLRLALIMYLYHPSTLKSALQSACDKLCQRKKTAKIRNRGASTQLRALCCALC